MKLYYHFPQDTRPTTESKITRGKGFSHFSCLREDAVLKEIESESLPHPDLSSLGIQLDEVFG